MTTALCTPEAVLKRLGDLDLPDSEVGMIEEAIEDASDAARDYGSPTRAHRGSASTRPTT